MEFINRLILVLLIGITSTAFSQNEQDLMVAFSSSYELEAKGEYSDAIGVLKGVYVEDSYEINLRLGWLTYMAGLFSESAPYYQNCIDLKPLSVEARLGLINPNAAMGNWTLVENTYHEILKIDPENSTALYRLGSIYYGKSDYATASKYFERLLNHYPFDYDSMLMSAWTYYHMGEMRKAKVLINKVMLYSPGDKSATEGLGLIE